MVKIGHNPESSDYSKKNCWYHWLIHELPSENHSTFCFSKD